MRLLPICSTVVFAALMLPLALYASTPDTPLVAAIKADYPLTKVGVALLQFDYNRITEQGVVLTVRIPGIYADVAGTKQSIIKTNIENNQASQQKGYLASLSKTGQSRTLNPAETVYVTRLDVKDDTVHMELLLLTTNVTTLAFGDSTRYRSEVVFRIPNLPSLTPDEVKKTIDGAIADAATANAVESKTIKIGMSYAEVKGVLGNPEKVVDLGTKVIYVYKDMKVTFKDAQVADVD
jgi:hypothetical protein